jgi:hypothetical protein
MKKALLVVAFMLVATHLVPGREHDLANASSPGTVDAPLLSCADFNGDGPVAGADFFALLGKFGTAYPALNFSYLYDLDANDNITGGDFFATLADFGQTCPEIDSQIADATLAVLALGSGVLDCTESAMNAAGYYRSSNDVPGQGVHYSNPAYNDGVFEPEHPEGLVCDNPGGRLIAQLYVVSGASVGWVEDPGPGPDLGPNAGSCWDGVDNGGDTVADAADGDCGSGIPVGAALDDVDIDPLCNVPDCSWATDEGWHLHYRLCTIQIGSPGAMSFPLAPGSDESDCEAFHNSCPLGCYNELWVFNYRVGWMGHLWNHDLNENLIADSGGMNGRFADCYPDAQGWKAHNCPQ